MTEEADHVGWSLGALKMVDACLPRQKSASISEVMDLPREHFGWHLNCPDGSASSSIALGAIFSSDGT